MPQCRRPRPRRRPLPPCASRAPARRPFRHDDPALRDAA
jgi:hypothetical protein